MSNDFNSLTPITPIAPPQIVPFTYRDGHTFIEILKELNRYLDKLTTEINNEFSEWNERVNALIAQINEFVDQAMADMNSGIAQMEALIEQAEELIDQAGQIVADVNNAAQRAEDAANTSKGHAETALDHADAAESSRLAASASANASAQSASNAAQSAIDAAAAAASINIGDLVSVVLDAMAGDALVDSLHEPFVVAHRGGASVNPEHSMEAYVKSYNMGYSPEADVHMLATGELVCIHDNTTTRTMNISQPVSSTTASQWRNAYIKPPVKGNLAGSSRGTPTFFTDYLDRFGGRIALFPELKDANPIAREKFCDAIVDRNLQRSVVAQSFTFADCEYFVSRNIRALHLTNDRNPSEMVAAGVEFVGVSMNATAAYIASCVSAGLKVIAYTAQTKADYDLMVSRGCSGVFANDPREVTRDYVGDVAVDMRDGNIPPGTKVRLPPSGSYPNPACEIAGNALVFHRPTTSQTGNLAVRLGSLGYGLSTGAKLRFTAVSELPTVAGSGDVERSWLFGVYLGTEPADEPVQEFAGGVWRLAMVRRNGQKNIYEKRSAASSTTSLGTNTASTAYATAGGRSVPMEFEVEFTTDSVAIRNLTRNDTDLVVSASPLTIPGAYISFAINGSETRIENIRLVA